MSVEILPVAPEHVRRVWPLVDKYVESALVYTNGCFLPQDVCDFCEVGRMQLWMAVRGDDVLAALVSEVITYPRKRVVGVPFIGGKELRSWFRKALYTIEAWSKEMGCAGMQGGARRGWGKLAKMQEVGCMLFKSYDMGAPLEMPESVSRELH